MNKEQKIQLFSRLATVAAAACIFIAVLLLLNYLQSSRADPLESAAMEALLERLEAEPDNEALKTEIRNLDLLARKAFFNSQWQVNTGAILLLANLLLFGFSLNVLNKLNTKIEMPEPEEADVRPDSKQPQRAIVAAVVVLALVALGAALLTRDHLSGFDADEGAPPASAPEEIEVVEVATYDAGSAEVEGTVDTSMEAAVAASPDTPAVASAKPAEEEPAAPIVVDYPGAASVWQQHGAFRGPFGNGVSVHKSLPTAWDGAAGQNIRWKAPLPGKGNNSPITWGDRLFLAAARGRSQLVLCYNRHSGALLWQQELGNVPGSPPAPPNTTDDTGLSAPTLATDGVRVYAIFATGDIAGLSMGGKLAWAHNLGLPDNHYGHSSSLQTWQGKLFVQYDTNKGAKVMALDCGSGATLWETERDVKISWASPILAPVGGKYQLILSADPLVAAYDIDTGKELWSVDCMMGEVGPSPAYGSGLAFAANEYARLVAIRPEGGGTIVWETNEYLPEVASPATADGLLYIGTSYGVLACYDALTGDKYWEQDCGSGFYASPMIADGKVYALGQEGVMYIFRHAKEKELIGEPPLGEKAVATPAFANGRIYLRGEKHLYCIGS